MQPSGGCMQACARRLRTGLLLCDYHGFIARNLHLVCDTTFHTVAYLKSTRGPAVRKGRRASRPARRHPLPAPIANEPCVFCIPRCVTCEPAGGWLAQTSAARRLSMHAHVCPAASLPSYLHYRTSSRTQAPTAATI